MEDDAHPVLAPEAEGERHAGHDLDHRAQGRHRADDAPLEVDPVDVGSCPLEGPVPRAGTAGRVLDRAAEEEERPDRADRRSEHVAGAVDPRRSAYARPHRARLLAEGAIQTARHVRPVAAGSRAAPRRPGQGTARRRSRAATPRERGRRGRGRWRRGGPRPRKGTAECGSVPPRREALVDVRAQRLSCPRCRGRGSAGGRRLAPVSSPGQDRLGAGARRGRIDLDDRLGRRAPART